MGGTTGNGAGRPYAPPLEMWAEPLRWLTPQQRERIESAEFYELLQREITRRFLRCLQRPG